MNSLEKVLFVYCTIVSFFCITILVGMLKLRNAMEILNKNQKTLEDNIEEVDNFNVEMWEKQIEINELLLGIPNETY